MNLLLNRETFYFRNPGFIFHKSVFMSYSREEKKMLQIQTSPNGRWKILFVTESTVDFKS